MRIAAGVIGLALVVTACGGGDQSSARLSATSAWARPTPGGASNGVVYLRIISPTNDSIISASVPASVANSAELHETMGAAGGAAMPNMPDMATGGGEMTMTPLDSVPLPAGQPVVFEPGGKHIMLVGLAAPLLGGQHFTLNLTLASGPALPIDVVVADNPP